MIKRSTFFDNKEFELIQTPLPKDDPLKFEDKKKYADRLKAARKLTGQDDAVLIAKGKIQNNTVLNMVSRIQNRNSGCANNGLVIIVRFNQVNIPLSSYTIY